MFRIEMLLVLCNDQLYEIQNTYTHTAHTQAGVHSGMTNIFWPSD